MPVYINQNFEGAGFDNGETWLVYTGDTGAANPDYTADPLRGSQSLHMKDDDSEGTYAVNIFSDGTGVNTLYGFFQIKFKDFIAVGSNKEIMHTYNTSGGVPTEVHEILWHRCVAGPVVNLGIKFPDSTFLYGTAELSLNTKYYVWFYFNRDSSSQSDGWVKVSTDPEIPAGNDIEWTNRSFTGNSYRGTGALGFTTENSNGYEYIVDQVLVQDTAIGNMGDYPVLTQSQFRFFDAGDELPHMDAAVVPVIETADITGSGNNTAETSPDIAYPAHNLGDLIIQVLVSDADAAHTSPGANGPNGETINTICFNQETGGANGPHLSVVWWVASANTAAGNQVWTIASEQWTGFTIVVPAGEFYATTPIGTISNLGYNNSDAATADMPAFTPNRSGGRVVVVGGVDTDPMDASYAPSGWTGRYTLDRGAVSCFCATRDALSVASTEVAAASFGINPSDSYTCIAFVVNGTVAVADGRTPLAAAGTDPELEVDTDYGVSIRVQNTGAATTEGTYKWQYKLNAGSWTDITSSSDVIQVSATADFANGADVPEYIGGTGSYVTNNNAALDTTGQLVLAAVLGVGESFESHLNFQIIGADVEDNDIIYLRIVYEDGTAFDSYGTADTNIPAITVNKAGGTAYTLDCDGGSYAVTGTAMGPEHDRVIGAVAGSYALTGTAMSPEHDKQVAASAGSYAVTGTAMAPEHDYVIGIEAGAYDLTGAVMSPLHDAVIDAAGGSCAVTGQVAGVYYGRAIDADAGYYTLSGAVAGLLRAANLALEAGSYALSGAAVAALLGRVLSAGAGAYAIAGQDVTLIYTPVGGYIISAEGGVYFVAGADVGVMRDAKVAADPGSYIVTGQAAAALLGRMIAAGAGVYLLDGQAADALRDAVIGTGSGEYGITGFSVGDYTRFLEDPWPPGDPALEAPWPPGGPALELGWKDSGILGILELGEDAVGDMSVQLEPPWP